MRFVLCFILCPHLCVVAATFMNSGGNLPQSPVVGQVMSWNGSIWVNTNISFTGAASTTDLVTASNILHSRLVANDTTTSNGVVALLIANDTVTSNGVVAYVLTTSNLVRLVVGLDATNHANAVLQSATNYANGVTNSSIVRQLELTAASNAVVALLVANDTTTSNALVTFTLTASNAVFLVAGLDATNHANAILQSATNYANGVTNSSIVRQSELTTASNVLNSAIVAATNSASVTNWINSRQPATANLTNWSNIPTGEMANVVSATFLTNWAGSVSNLTQTKQNGTALLTNLSGNPYVAYTNALTKTSQTVTGAGSGSTNYLITLSTNSVNYFYMGSSNVNIYTVAGSTFGSPIAWRAVVTNLSADTWGFIIASGTNRWRWFSPMYGTNRPTVLTNNTALVLNGLTDGTNNIVDFYYLRPALTF